MSFPATLPIPEPVLTIARRLEEAGFETWCVGGAVRDNLLGIDNHDFDLATAARPADVQRLFRRTVPVGVEHGTVAVLDQEHGTHEVTTFRRDVVTDGRHAQVEFGASLEDDLARRDFTINAIAYHPTRHEWRDPFGGAADLAAKTIRAVGDAHQRFQEDYLRILRALRFAARFGFQIDRPTWDAAKQSIAGLERLSAERVRGEWFRGLESARWPSGLVELWRDVGAMDGWLREIGRGERGTGKAERGTGKGKRGTGNGERGTGNGEAAIDRFATRDAVLITSHLSSDPVATLTRLKCSSAEIERGRRIAQHRESWPDPVSQAAVRRWLARVGVAADDLIAIAVAEEWGAPLAEAVGRVRESGAAVTIGQLAVNGTDLIEAGIPKGPEVGEILRALLDQVLEDPSINIREGLLAIATQMHSGKERREPQGGAQQ